MGYFNRNNILWSFSTCYYNPQKTKKKSEGFFKDNELIFGNHYLLNGDYYSVGQYDDKNDLIHIGNQKSFVLCYHSDGSLWYEGEMVDDMPHGKGIEYYAVKNGERAKLYEGNWVNGKYDGDGEKYRADGSFERTQWKNGKRIKSNVYSISQQNMEKLMDSYGKRSSDKIVYVELWKKDTRFYRDLMHFFGFEDHDGNRVFGKTYSDDDYNAVIYQGFFNNNKYDGQGVLTKSRIYEFNGLFTNGIMKNGILSIDSYSIYEGSVNEHGEMDGEGRLFYIRKNKSDKIVKFEGSFKSNHINGFGKLYYDAMDQRRYGQLQYCGMFKDDLYNGYGMLFGENYSYYIGGDINNMNSVQEIEKYALKMKADDMSRINPSMNCWLNGDLNGIVTIKTPTLLYKMQYKDGVEKYISSYQRGNTFISGDIRPPKKGDIIVDYIGLSTFVFDGSCDVIYNRVLFFRGQFTSGKQMGKGTLFNDDGTIAYFIGECNEFIPHGLGTITKIPLTGKWVNGVLTEGKIEIEKTSTYKIYFEGSFSSSIYYMRINNIDVSGKGVITKEFNNANSTVIYEGDILHGRYHGNGKEMKDGDIISQGMYSNGLLDGENCVKIVDNMRYEGTFKQGKYIYGKISRSTNEQPGYDMEVNENVLIRKENSEIYTLNYYYDSVNKRKMYNSLYTTTNDKLNVGLIRKGNCIVNGTFKDGKPCCQCNFYRISDNTINNDDLFSTSSIAIDKRLSNMRCTWSALYIDGIAAGDVIFNRSDNRLVSYNISSQNGWISYDYKTTYKGELKAVMDQTDPLIFIDIVRHGNGEGVVDVGTYRGMWNNDVMNGKGFLCHSGMNCEFEGEWKDGELLKGVQKANKYTIEGSFDRNYNVIGDQIMKADGMRYELKINEMRNGLNACVFDDATNSLLYMGPVRHKTICVDNIINKNKALSSNLSSHQSDDKDLNNYHRLYTWLNNPSLITSPIYRYSRWVYLPQGQQCNEYIDGCLSYYGGMLCGLYHGVGTKYVNDNEKYDGNWKFGKMWGKITRICGNRKYKCEFYDGLLKGNCEIWSVLDGIETMVYCGEVNEMWQPTKGNFFIMLMGARCSVERVDAYRYIVKNQNAVVYNGCMKSDESLMYSCCGQGQLSDYSKCITYSGMFLDNCNIDNCTVMTNNQIIFKGSIRNMQFSNGKQYYNGIIINDGLFENGRLVRGYKTNGDRKIAVGEVEKTCGVDGFTPGNR